MDKTLVKGLSVLEFLVERAAPCSVSDVAQEFALVPSNAHRTLKTLVARGYVRQLPDTRYEPSLRLFELGSRVAGALDIRQVAKPAMAQLAADSQETIHLVVRDGDHVVYLDKIDSPQPVAAYSRIGGRAPAQCVASGKALLACALPDRASAALGWLRKAVPDLQPYTDTSHIKHDTLLEDLLQVRQQGYAVNRGEWRHDVSGLGAPVFDGLGQAVGALGISMPTVRATQERLPDLISLLREASATTSELLGHRPRVTVPAASFTNLSLSRA